MKRTMTVPVFFALSFLAIGCATHISKPLHENVRPQVNFGEFKQVEMKEAVLSEKFATSGPNQKALSRINEILFEEMRNAFPQLKRIPSGSEFTKSSERTLQITPFIPEIKFIGGAARFWVGALAGSSAVLANVTYHDSSNGKEINKASFYRQSSAMGGAWTIGGADNLMLDSIARDIVNYTARNR